MTYRRGITSKELRRAYDVGLRAEADVFVAAIKEGYRPPEYFIPPAGPKRKKPISGRLINSIKRTGVQGRGDGRTIAVYSTTKYAMFWEVGWRPWSGRRKKLRGKGMLKKPKRSKAKGKFLRKEVWREARERKANEMQQAFVDAVKTSLGG